MIRSLVRIAVLVLVSAGVGVGYARYLGLPLLPDVQQLEAQRSEHEQWIEATAISLDEFIEHYQMGWLVIDARPREMFEEGHLDAPLIMNIPADEADYHIERVLPYRGQPIVLYCSSETCDSAETLWHALAAWGFSYEVRVFHPGWRGIEAAGLPTIRGPDLLAEGDDVP